MTSCCGESGRSGFISANTTRREDSEFNNLEEIPGNAERFICAMDFFTVGSVLGTRFYVFAAISHKTLEIFQFAITENLAREFLRQQLMLFTESIATRAYLIHDNALMLNIEYLGYNLVSVRTGEWKRRT